MNWSSIWAVVALSIASLVAAFTLLTEKKEAEDNPSFLLRWRKPVLYLLTAVARVIGVVQIRNADKESREADQKHITEHQQDQQKISNLQESVKTLGDVNDISATKTNWSEFGKK